MKKKIYKIILATVVITMFSNCGSKVTICDCLKDDGSHKKDSEEIEFMFPNMMIRHWVTGKFISVSKRGKKDKDTFMGKLIKPIYNVSSREVQLTTLGLFLFAVLKIRLWDKRRTDYIYNLMYSKYRIFCQIYFPDTYIDSDGSVYTEQTEQEEQTEQTIIN